VSVPMVVSIIGRAAVETMLYPLASLAGIERPPKTAVPLLYYLVVLR
jgi:hypothetical protein